MMLSELIEVLKDIQGKNEKDLEVKLARELSEDFYAFKITGVMLCEYKLDSKSDFEESVFIMNRKFDSGGDFLISSTEISRQVDTTKH